MAPERGEEADKTKPNSHTYENLKDHHILIHAEHATLRKLPGQLNALKESILDFDFTVDKRLGPGNDGGTTSSQDGEYESLEGKYSSKIIDTTEKDSYETAVKEAYRLFEGNDAEEEWKFFYFTHFFNPLQDKTLPRNSDSRISSRTKFYFEFFESRSEKLWTMFSKAGPFHGSRTDLLAPKPDWAAYFPIYDLANSSRVICPRRWDWASSAQLKRNLVGEFRRDYLECLVDVGLRCHVSLALENGRPEPADGKDMLTYPWLIVEHKNDFKHKKEEECFCQAANGASAALDMYENLVKYGPNQPSGLKIPPVVTITTIGPIVKIWIAYREKCSKTLKGLRYYRETHSQCIWTGNITRVIDAIKLGTALENIHCWAMRVLRPRISLYLDHWACRHGYYREESSTSREGSLLQGSSPNSPQGEEEDPDSLDSKLRTIVTSYHDATVERIEELLTRKFGHVPARKCTTSGTQTNKSPSCSDASAGENSPPKPFAFEFQSGRFLVPTPLWYQPGQEEQQHVRAGSETGLGKTQPLRLVWDDNGKSGLQDSEQGDDGEESDNGQQHGDQKGRRPLP